MTENDISQNQQNIWRNGYEELPFSRFFERENMAEIDCGTAYIRVVQITAARCTSTRG